LDPPHGAGVIHALNFKSEVVKNDERDMLNQSTLAFDYKAPGGKLVRVRLIEENGIIRSVRISGDFFLVPEDGLAKLEKMLEDTPLRGPELKLLVDRFFRGTGAQGLGVSPDDFVKAILSVEKEA
jgi:Bacterial lipoate protein ligase C-terminus